MVSDPIMCYHVDVRVYWSVLKSWSTNIPKSISSLTEFIFNAILLHNHVKPISLWKYLSSLQLAGNNNITAHFIYK
jgi:hypothetical protein